MESQKIVLLGSGGLAREVIEIIESINEDSTLKRGFRFFEILGLVTEDTKPLPQDYPFKILGNDECLNSLPDTVQFIACIGDSKARFKAVSKAEAAGLKPATLIHPSAVVAKFDVSIGHGSVIGALVNLSCNIRIGSHVFIDRGSTIGHDTKIEDFVSIYIGSTIAGNVTIRKLSTIGAGATIIQNLEIGPESFVGAGSVVVSEVKRNGVVVGNPAKEMRTEEK